MKKIEFKKWLETCTSTGDVATFSLPIAFGKMARRIFPSLIAFGEEDPFFKKK